MPNRADTIVTFTVNPTYSGAGTSYLVQTPAGVLYHVYVDNANDVAFRKSTDGGRTWSVPTVVFAGTVTALSVWYDRWSNIAAGLIHCAYTESGGSDTLYRTINTESSDALSTQTTIFAGASQATGQMLTISRARGGNVYCRVCIDAGVEGGFFRLQNANVPNGAWDAARTIDEALATTDQMILLPGFAADNQDMLAIFWDASADEISRKIYDDSANSWAETSIATSMVDMTASGGGNGFPNFAAAVDIANSRIILIAWSANNLANADLRCWIITESSITEVTNVVLNSGANQALCAFGIDTVNGHWYAFYCGNTAGTETWRSSMHVYMKVSTDEGTTWGAETQVTQQLYGHRQLVTIPRFVPPFVVLWFDDTVPILHRASVSLLQPRAVSAIGL